MTQTLLTACLGELIATAGERASDCQPDANPRAVVRARYYIHDDVGRDLHLAEMATAAGAGAFGLVREFTRTVSVPPHRYQMLLRADRARSSCRAGRSAAYVATDLGCSDQSQRNRWFKRVYGTTPGRYPRAS